MTKKAKKKHGGGTRATVSLERAGIPFDTHPYEVDPRADSYAVEAAAALDLPEQAVVVVLERERRLASPQVERADAALAQAA